MLLLQRSKSKSKRIADKYGLPEDKFHRSNKNDIITRHEVAPTPLTESGPEYNLAIDGTRQPQASQDRRRRQLSNIAASVRKIQASEQLYRISREEVTLLEIQTLVRSRPGLDIQPSLREHSAEAILKGRFTKKGEPLYNIAQWGLTRLEIDLRIGKYCHWPPPGAQLTHLVGPQLIKYHGSPSKELCGHYYRYTE